MAYMWEILRYVGAWGGAEEMCTGTINDQHANYRRTASGPDPTPRVCGLNPGQVLGLDVSCCVLFQLGF
jgi:hypothetical protein